MFWNGHIIVLTMTLKKFYGSTEVGSSCKEAQKHLKFKLFLKCLQTDVQD